MLTVSFCPLFSLLFFFSYCHQTQENVDYRGKTVELAGGVEFSWGELVDFMLDTTHRGPFINVEHMTLENAKFWAGLAEIFPEPLWTVDEVRLEPPIRQPPLIFA